MTLAGKVLGGGGWEGGGGGGRGGGGGGSETATVADLKLSKVEVGAANPRLKTRQNIGGEPCWQALVKPDAGGNHIETF